MKSVESDMLSACHVELKVELRGSFSKDLPSLLLIHGWASSSDIWQDVWQALNANFNVYTLDLPGVNSNGLIECESISRFLYLYCRDVHSILPASYAVVGWSLGGSLASLIAEKFPKSIFALITVATNPEFVQSEKWPCAMQAEVFQQFGQHLEKGEKKTIERFLTLQTQGAHLVKQDLRGLKKLQSTIEFNSIALKQSLQWLKEIKLHEIFKRLAMPTLHQYGRKDQLVPVEVVNSLAPECSKNTEFQVFEQSAHLPFYSEKDKWLDAVSSFLSRHAKLVAVIATDKIERLLDKRVVSLAFSKAAVNYDQHANFQHKVGKRLLELLRPHVKKSQEVLDLGSGTGYFSTSLEELFSTKAVVEMDLAMGMLSCSRDKNGEGLRVQSDIEALPFLNLTFDAVFANLSIQWCQHYSAVLDEIYVSLANDGVLALTTILDGSLLELENAWNVIDDSLHTNDFVTEQYLNELVKVSSFIELSWVKVCHKEYFYNKKDLFNSIKGIGAGNHLRDRKGGLTGKHQYQHFMAELDAQRDQQGRYTLSYNVLYTILKKN